MAHLRRYAADTARNRRSVQAQVGPNAKRVIMAVEHGAAVPDVAHVDSILASRSKSEDSTDSMGRLLRSS